MVLLDSNVVLDIATRDPVWSEWSLAMREAARLEGVAAVSEIAFAEISVRYSQREEVDELMTLLDLEIAPMPRDALFLAAKAFQRYRRAGGTKTGVLPDFLIGAQAAVLGVPLITRDPRRYRTYFATIELVTPEPGNRLS